MGPDRPPHSEATVTPTPICRSEADSRSGGVHWDPIRAPEWNSLEHAAQRDGLRLGQCVLEAPGALATGGRLEEAARHAVSGPPRTGPTRSRTRDCRQRLAPGAARGKKTGPNPTDRRKAGSKHHLLTEAQGIPLAAILTSANRNDITQLLPLVDAIPPLRGCPGRPRRKPSLIQGDRGYDSQPHRNALHRRGIATQFARRRQPHGSGLGRTRWVIERTLAWLHRFRRLAARYERRPCIHEAFLSLGCALICWYYLEPVL